MTAKDTSISATMPRHSSKEKVSAGGPEGAEQVGLKGQGGRHWAGSAVGMMLGMAGPYLSGIPG